MTTVAMHLYRALKAAGVSEEQAAKAAEEAASYENRFAKIEADLLLIKWMLGITIAGIASLIAKTFF